MIGSEFAGRVAFVTGGTSGIGLSTARAFGRAGAKVVLAARGEEAGRSAVHGLAEEGIEALFLRTDVRDEEAVERAREAAGDKDVHIMGGADVIRQALDAGLVDTVHLVVSPRRLGPGGVPLFGTGVVGVPGTEPREVTELGSDCWMVFDVHRDH